MLATSEQSAFCATSAKQPPSVLGENGREKWEQLFTKMVPTQANTELLALACGAWEDWCVACSQAGDAAIEGTGGTKKTNPVLDAKINAGKFYRQLIKDIQWTEAPVPDDGGSGRPDGIDD